MTGSLIVDMPTYTVGSIRKAEWFSFSAMDAGGCSTLPMANHRGQRRCPTHITLSQVNSDTSHDNHHIRRGRMNFAAEQDRLGNTCTYSYHISPSVSNFAPSFSNSKGLLADLSSCYRASKFYWNRFFVGSFFLFTLTFLFQLNASHKQQIYTRVLILVQPPPQIFLMLQECSLPMLFSPIMCSHYHMLNDKYVWFPIFNLINYISVTFLL
jgi:hypothetical protein